MSAKTLTGKVCSSSLSFFPRSAPCVTIPRKSIVSLIDYSKHAKGIVKQENSKSVYRNGLSQPCSVSSSHATVGWAQAVIHHRNRASLFLVEEENGYYPQAHPSARGNRERAVRMKPVPAVLSSPPVLKNQIPTKLRLAPELQTL